MLSPALPHISGFVWGSKNLKRSWHQNLPPVPGSLLKCPVLRQRSTGADRMLPIKLVFCAVMGGGGVAACHRKHQTKVNLWWLHLPPLHSLKHLSVLTNFVSQIESQYNSNIQNCPLINWVIEPNLSIFCATQNIAKLSKYKFWRVDIGLFNSL